MQYGTAAAAAAAAAAANNVCSHHVREHLHTSRQRTSAHITSKNICTHHVHHNINVYGLGRREQLRPRTRVIVAAVRERTFVPCPARTLAPKTTLLRKAPRSDAVGFALCLGLGLGLGFGLGLALGTRLMLEVTSSGVVVLALAVGVVNPAITRRAASRPRGHRTLPPPPSGRKGGQRRNATTTKVLHVIVDGARAARIVDDRVERFDKVLVLQAMVNEIKIPDPPLVHEQVKLEVRNDGGSLLILDVEEGPA